MDYVKLGSTGLDVSPIAIGAMTYGEPGRGHPVWSLAEEDSRPLISKARYLGASSKPAWELAKALHLQLPLASPTSTVPSAPKATESADLPLGSCPR